MTWADPFAIHPAPRAKPALAQRILGVDPGAHGALALIGMGAGWDFIDACEMPIRNRGKTVTNNVLDGKRIAKIVAEWRPTIVIVEDVQPMPNRAEKTADGEVRERESMPASIAFTFGGMCLGVVVALEALGYDVMPVRPTSWKKAAGLMRVGDRKRSEVKAEALRRAREIWPEAPLTRAADESKAEAALIARFGFSSQVRLL